MSSYSQKLADPRWQEVRERVLERDGHKCCWCGKSKEKLHVHHNFYQWGSEPWEYADEDLQTLCATCHESVTYTKDLLIEKLEKKRSAFTLFLVVQILNILGGDGSDAFYRALLGYKNERLISLGFDPKKWKPGDIAPERPTKPIIVDLEWMAWI